MPLRKPEVCVDYILYPFNSGNPEQGQLDIQDLQLQKKMFLLYLAHSNELLTVKTWRPTDRHNIMCHKNVLRSYNIKAIVLYFNF